MYEEIRLDEPWDSPHNRKFANTPLPVFKCPSCPDEAGSGTHTNYMVIDGDAALFRGPELTKISQITDGTSNTLMIVEVKQSSTPWMKPADLDYEKLQMVVNSGATDMGSYHPGGAQAALADGSTRFLSETIDSQTLRSLVTRDGGETVTRDF